MMSLRFVLIVVGVLIIVGVYLATAAKRRRESRVTFDRRFTRLDIPDVILQHEDDEDGDGDGHAAGVSARAAPPALDTDDDPPAVPRGVVLAADAGDDELPRIVNKLDDEPPGDARPASDQMDLFGADTDAARRARAASANRARPTPAVPDNGLVSLYVRARPGGSFGGPELVRALNAVGMRHGDMSIFHHFGAGELVSERALFSAANLFEPGIFDLARIEAMRTTGVVLFMQLPTELDGPVAFELLLNTAQRLSELVGGELCASPREPLDAQRIAALRRRVAQFDDAGA